MSEREEWFFGQQRVWVEAPDLVRLTLRGTFELTEAEAYMPIAFRLGERLGPFALLLDMRDLEAVSSAARRRLSFMERAYPYRACAIYGASFALGVMVTMTFKAGRILMPSAFTFPLALFKNETEARAWLAPFRDGPARAR
jgi:hypothetical protein